MAKGKPASKGAPMKGGKGMPMDEKDMMMKGKMGKGKMGKGY